MCKVMAREEMIARRHVCTARSGRTDSTCFSVCIYRICVTWTHLLLHLSLFSSLPPLNLVHHLCCASWLTRVITEMFTTRFLTTNISKITIILTRFSLVLNFIYKKKYHLINFIKFNRNLKKILYFLWMKWLILHKYIYF